MKFRQIIPTQKYSKNMDGLFQACVRGDKKRFDEIKQEIQQAYERANWENNDD